jgi:dihydrofolate synthase/folylpolyglutamate synthase
MKIPSFERFITEKPLFYKEIDHQRIHHAYAILKPHIQHPKTIHLVGTNGKGSTGRIMATLLHHSGVKVGHFSSPHIIRFNERIWIEGAESSDEMLEQGHQILYAILGQEISETLSYFEYTTLLALVVMQREEVIVLEAGLGGEFDATNVVSKDLSVITPIGLDHQDFLGESIQEIASTKLNAIESYALLAQQPYEEVYEIAKRIASVQESSLYTMQDYPIDEEIVAIGESMGWASYLIENAHLAMKALEMLHLPYHKEDLRRVRLFGRFYPLSEHVTIDVGHNLLAARAILPAIQARYKQEKVVLVYNSLEDKAYGEILKLFAPYLKRVEIIEIDTPRAVPIKNLQEILEFLRIPFKMFQNIGKYDNYLVFGSFYVVEAFLKKQNYFKNQ